MIDTFSPRALDLLGRKREMDRRRETDRRMQANRRREMNWKREMNREKEKAFILAVEVSKVALYRWDLGAGFWSSGGTASESSDLNQLPFHLTVGPGTLTE